jgi:hypothetical protein
MKIWFVAACVGLIGFGAGHHVGRWSTIDEWATSAAQTKADRLDCWHRSHSETCIEADAFVSMTVQQF